MSETYEAMEKGVVDVLLAPLETQWGYKHAEVTKYITLLPISFTTNNYIAMNKKKWDLLPEDIKKVFTDVSAGWVENTGRIWWYTDIEGSEYYLSLKKELITIPPEQVPEWEKRLTPLTDKWIAQATALKLPAAEYVKYGRERVDYWNARQPTEKTVVEWFKKEFPK
jgi:TRAP-type C4-dicarboxylate transport system substrate-binding protein